MYLAKTLTLRSLPEIGRRFGGRDHTTVLHAVRKIEHCRHDRSPRRSSAQALLQDEAIRGAADRLRNREHALPAQSQAARRKPRRLLDPRRDGVA